MHPFLDKHGILRVGGRLSKAELSYDQRHPIILSNNHHFTNLIVMHEHKKQLHAGPQLLLANIRLKFWILSGLNTIKKVLRSCIICFRVKPKGSSALMGDLPESRITPSRPFYDSGVDFAGPINIKTSKLKNSKILKSYIAVFVCFVTKAVHIEVVSDLTTESFLNALKRFISRRGKCRNLYSDNGTNFVGANNELREFSKLLNSEVHKIKVN